MKKIFFPIFAFILISCAPQVIPPSPALGEGTGVRETPPPPTETPMPTFTPTPIAVDGIAEDAEGNKLAYLNGEWVKLADVPGDYAKVMVNEDGVVVALDMATGEWVEVKKTYPSCAMPELIAQQDADFTMRTGIDLDNPDANSQSRKFANALDKVAYIGFEQKQGVRDVVVFSIIKTGIDLVSVKDAAGGKIDKLLCLYGRNSVVPNETLVFILGWIDGSGNFVNLSFGADTTNLSAPVGITPDKQLDFFRNLPDGAVLTIHVHTFSGVSSIDEVNSVSPPPSPNQERVRELLRFMGNDMIDRLSSANNVNEFWAAQDASRGDLGFLPAGDWNLAGQEDLSP